jgi:hypothetical protein
MSHFESNTKVLPMGLCKNIFYLLGFSHMLVNIRNQYKIAV